MGSADFTKVGKLEGTCDECGQLLDWATTIDHMIDDHGVDPNEIKVEVGRYVVGEATKMGEAGCGHFVRSGDPVMVFESTEGRVTVTCEGCGEKGPPL